MDDNAKLDLILKKITQLEEKFDDLEKKCDRMDKHITFIESVYVKIQSPFNRLMNFCRIIPLSIEEN
jgi:hypothetical protein